MSDAARSSASGPDANAGAGAQALRLALTLPGGIAPGTFEAGAVCGLLGWIQELNALEPGIALVDVIAGASAGALSGLLAARVLLSGDDPVAVFREAWVAAPSLRALRGRGPWAPLSLRPARDVARKLLFAPRAPQPRWQQTSPVTLDIALGCLRGFAQEIPHGRAVVDGEPPLLTTNYLDWTTVELNDIATSSEDLARQWTEAIGSALASASHPLAFRARRLDRESYREEYVASGVVNLPPGHENLTLWYTDGGLLDDEPLGRCVRRAGKLDKAGMPSRLVLLVRSSVRSPPSAESSAWSGFRRPRWTETVARALDLIATHAAGRDLLEVEQVNARLRWIDEVAVKIAELVSRDDRTRAEFEGLLERIEDERAAFTEMARRPVTRVGPSHGNLVELVRTVLRSAAGLAAKNPVEVAVVTADPTFARPQAVRSLVGFLERRHREDHFAAGYWSMMRWIEQASTLTRRVNPDLIRDAALTTERRVRQPGTYRMGRGGSPGISRKTRYELAKLGARTAWIAREDLDATFDVPERARRASPTSRPPTGSWRRIVGRSAPPARRSDQRV